jgi:hypothetical protein
MTSGRAISAGKSRERARELQMTSGLPAPAGAATAAEMAPAGLLRNLHPHVMKKAVGCRLG